MLSVTEAKILIAQCIPCLHSRHLPIQNILGCIPVSYTHLDVYKRQGTLNTHYSYFLYFKLHFLKISCFDDSSIAAIWANYQNIFYKLI